MIERRALAGRRPASALAKWILASAVSLGILTSSLGAETLFRVGVEFQVNTVTANFQKGPRLALRSDHGFVVVWNSIAQDGGSLGIFGRRFAASGAPLASEFQVNSYTVGAQSYPTVATNAAGAFVVAWRSYGQDGSQNGVFTRRFDSSGTPLAAELQVNIYTLNTQRNPVVALDGTGKFVIAWDSVGPDGDSYGIFARRFDAAGAPQGGELQVNSHTVSFQLQPAIAMDPSGDFVVTWQSFFQDDATGAGVFAQRFDAAGTALASELQVNSYTPGFQGVASVAMDGDGDFVVAWRSDNQDGFGDGVFAQRFSSDGARQGGEFQVNAYTASTQSYPAIAAQGNGDFVVVWHSSGGQDGGDYGVFGRSFDSAGTPLAGEFQITTYTSGAQNLPTIASTPGGSFVVAWTSYGEDGDNAGIFAQRFAKLVTLDVDGDGQVTALTDGLLVLRRLFGFTGTTLTSGAVDLAACVRCDGAAIQAYLQALGPQPIAAAGPEFQVNAYTPSSQDVPAIAMAADGHFVVAWQNLYQDGDFNGVAARRFSSTGVPIGGELQVNSYTSGSQYFPDVGMDADGDFVVVWDSYRQDGNNRGVFLRRFDSAGVAQAVELQVNSFTPGSQTGGAIAVAPGGGFVVVWGTNGQDQSSYGIFARRFDSAGTALADEFQVNAYTLDFQIGPAIGMEPDGDFVVAWRSNGQDGFANGVFARRFDSAGAALADEFQVNTRTSGSESEAEVGVDADGDFVIVYRSDGQDGSGLGLFAQRFDSSGARQAAELQVNRYTPDDQQRARIAIDAGGDFLVAWMSAAQDGSDDGVFARRFDSAGGSIGGEMQLNSYTAGPQKFPAAAARDGRFVVTWSSYQQDGGELYGLFGRRFIELDVLDVDGDGALTALTDGLLVLRFLFGFTGATLTSGAVGPNCTRCDAATIASYLQTLM